MIGTMASRSRRFRQARQAHHARAATAATPSVHANQARPLGMATGGLMSRSPLVWESAERAGRFVEAIVI